MKAAPYKCLRQQGHLISKITDHSYTSSAFLKIGICEVMQQTPWLCRSHVPSSEENSSSCLATVTRVTRLCLYSFMNGERKQAEWSGILFSIKNKGCPPSHPSKSILISRLVYFCFKRALKLKRCAQCFSDRPTYWPCTLSWHLAVKHVKSVFEECSLKHRLTEDFLIWWLPAEAPSSIYRDLK